MERAIGIIKREIEKRKSMLMNEEYFLRTNQIKCEIKSLDKVLDVVNKNYLLQRVSNSVCYAFDWCKIKTKKGNCRKNCKHYGVKQTDC